MAESKKKMKIFYFAINVDTDEATQLGQLHCFIHVMAQNFISGDLSNLIRSLIPYQEVFYRTILMRVKIYFKVQTKFHCPLYHIYPK